MGRGDKRTKKGKIFMGSFGVSRPARPHQSNKNNAAPEKEATEKKPKKAAAKKSADA